MIRKEILHQVNEVVEDFDFPGDYTDTFNWVTLLKGKTQNAEEIKLYEKILQRLMVGYEQFLETERGK